MTGTTRSTGEKPVESLEDVIVRFAGDSGDGMQLAGTQLTRSSAVFGNDVSTFPDYPSEIRAPIGTLAGVSGFQIHFSSHSVYTPGDRVDTLVAFNPAALKANIGDVRPGGIVVVNEDSFRPSELKKAKYDENPLDGDTLRGYRVFRVPVSSLTRAALKGSGLSSKSMDRCKNFFALGLIFWLYDRPMEPTLRWIDEKFGVAPPVADANRAVLKAGYNYGETCELFQAHYRVPKAPLAPGRYRRIAGNEATAIGLVAAAYLCGKELFYGSYPITPASDILHQLSRYKNYGVKTFQAEDEIAAMAAVVGAAFAGDLAVTGTSGPGLALKGEAIGLGVMTELPMVIVNVQRGGPSTGLPTKTEQTDLLQALWGRNGECPVCVLSASSPSDCFDVAIEACRLAIRYMTPVMLLTDGYIANGEEPWAIPAVGSLQKIEVHHPTEPNGEEGFLPFARNDELARPWAIPGTPGLEHRIGGLEKKDRSGEVCYESTNHEVMVNLRAKKIDSIAKNLPDQTVMGPEEGDLLVLGWGGTAGAIRSAVERVQAKGHSVAHAQLRYLFPLPPNINELLSKYKQILVPELNLGQLQLVIRAQCLVDTVGLHKIQGKPFLISEIETKIMELLSKGGAK